MGDSRFAEFAGGMPAPDITQLIAEGSSVYVFGEQRIFCPRYIASVVRLTDDHLELKLDPDDLAEARIRADEEVLIGFAASQRQMYFGATVIALAIQPRGHLLLSAPRDVEKWPQRSYVRAPLAVACELALALPGESGVRDYQGTTADLSASGARVRVAPALPAGEIAGAEGTIRLRFPDREAILTGCRVVRHLGSDGDGSEIAVQYSGLPETDEMQIQLLVLRATARRFLRVEASVPCRVELPDDRGQLSRYPGVTENVSAGGVLVRLVDRVSVQPGSRVSVQLSLPSRYLAVAAADVVRAVPYGAGTHLALDFGDLEELDHQSVIRFVVEQLRGVADAAALDAHGAVDSCPIVTEE